MMTHTKPVNKQAAIFLSRKSRVETLEEALSIFANKLSDKSVASSALDLLDQHIQDDSPTLTISVKIRKDQRTPGNVTAEMVTSLSGELGRESFYGLG
jgi:hypothetical protein